MDEVNEIIQFAASAGEIMLKNGAETYRVEDTMKRILKAYNYKIAEVFVTTTGIFASAGVTQDSRHVCTIVRRISRRGINLEKITLVNQLSRDVVNKQMSLAAAEEALMEIDMRPPYKRYIIALSAATACGTFTALFGATLIDSFIAFILGFIVGIVQAELSDRNVTVFVINMICGMFCSIIMRICLYLGIGNDYDRIIIGAIMPLLPGVATTNAIRDILSGDYTSGSSRMLEAILTAVSIAVGVGVGLAIWR